MDFTQYDLTAETDVSGIWKWAKPELCAEHMRLFT